MSESTDRPDLYRKKLKRYFEIMESESKYLPPGEKLQLLQVILNAKQLTEEEVRGIREAALLLDLGREAAERESCRRVRSFWIPSLWRREEGHGLLEEERSSGYGAISNGQDLEVQSRGCVVL